MWHPLIFVLPLISYTFCYYSIENYGAVANIDTNEAAYNNTKAIIDAFNAANQDSVLANRTVLLPSGNTYYFFLVDVANLENLTIRIEGTFAGSTNLTEWEKIIPGSPGANLYIANSTNITLTGGGTLDGQGALFWEHIWENDSYPRTHLVNMFHIKDLTIYNITFKNPGSWTTNFVDVLNVHIHDVDIFVDTMAQKQLAIKHNMWDNDFDFPKYPLYTDGMDIRGKNVLVENLRIQGFDDAVAIKPMQWGNNHYPNEYTNCSENMVIRNINVTYTIGMAIGADAPDFTVSCIRNITFENVNITKGIRAAYIKTLKSNNGTGIIDNITFRNFYSYGATVNLFTIGPQQNGIEANGCDPNFPYASNNCTPQPLITITNVLFENFTGVDTKMFPGFFLCDPTNPCKNISLINVQNDGNFNYSSTYLCENVEGIKENSNRLPDSCLTSITTSTIKNGAHQGCCWSIKYIMLAIFLLKHIFINQ